MHSANEIRVLQKTFHFHSRSDFSFSERRCFETNFFEKSCLKGGRRKSFSAWRCSLCGNHKSCAIGFLFSFRKTIAGSRCACSLLRRTLFRNVPSSSSTWEPALLKRTYCLLLHHPSYIWNRKQWSSQNILKDIAWIASNTSRPRHHSRRPQMVTNPARKLNFPTPKRLDKSFYLNPPKRIDPIKRSQKRSVLMSLTQHIFTTRM